MKRSAHGFIRSLHRSLCFQRGFATSFWDVAPALCFVSSYCARVADLTPPWSLRLSKVVDERLSSERVRHLAPGRRSKCPLRLFIFRAGYGPRSVSVALTLESRRRGVGSERVPNPAAGCRDAFVSSGAGVKKRSAHGFIRSLCFQSGFATSFRDVAPALCFISSYCARVADLAPPWSLRLSKVVDERLSSERVLHLAPGRRSKCLLRIFVLRAGYGPRSVLVALTLESRRRGVSSERVPNPAAGCRDAFVSSGAGVVGRSRCPLWCSTRSNNNFHSLFYPKCFQVLPKTPMDTPTPDKDLCNAKRKLKCIIPNLNDQNMQE
ncbi:hypothetical protein F2Q69_00049280 [Brassica cretica]|uniref:Uncharacterized protein n=1 Tax=Brassica cretica TaxID=69181 RepID=A0A8S9PXZ3_BRACR|nr:hypothetical protein F2Q69_00049280 [Brassica cretica]